MTSTSPTIAQEQRPANLIGLQQTLKEMFARTKSLIPTPQEKPVVVQGPVLMVKGK